MNHAEAAEVIKGTVSMKDVAGMLGYTPGRGGFMVCPFHGDHDASLKVYSGSGGWHCFGCGKGGSVIDFVMESEHCNFRQAVRLISDGMGLNLLTVDDMFQQNRNRAVQRAFDAVREAMDAMIDTEERHIELDQWLLTKELMMLEDKPVPERTADEWTRIHEIIDNMQYNDYLAEKCQEIRREVSEWRSKARSVRSP